MKQQSCESWVTCSSSSSSSSSSSRPVPVLMVGDRLTHSFKRARCKNNVEASSSSHRQSSGKLLTIHRTTPGSFASSCRGCTLQRRGSSLRLSRLPCSLGGGDVRSWSWCLELVSDRFDRSYRATPSRWDGVSKVCVPFQCRAAGLFVSSSSSSSSSRSSSSSSSSALRQRLLYRRRNDARRATSSRTKKSRSTRKERKHCS